MAQDIAETLRNQEIREWARTEGGWPDLSDKGRLPAAVITAHAAWEQARGGGDDGSAPDFGAAAAAMGLSPLDNDDDLPDTDAGGGGTVPPPPPEGQPGELQGSDTGLPPVASLEEARARVGAGKAQPGWARPPGGGGGGKPAGQPAAGKRRSRARQAPPPPDTAPITVTPEVLDDMAGKVAMLLTVPGAWWESVDPVCGGAFAQQAPAIVQTMVPVMARSQAVLRLFATDALYFQLFALAEAVAPVARAVYAHHYSADAKRTRAAEQRAAEQAQATEEDMAMYPSAPRIRGHVPDYRPARAQM